MSERRDKAAPSGRGRDGAYGTRERVMDVAEAHLAKEGYMGVSLEGIAREVGVTKPALYYHFPEGKEQLFVEISHRALRRMREGMERAMAAPEDGAGKLGAAARWLMAEREAGNPMNELRDVAKFVGERHQAGLAEGFFGCMYAPIQRAIASAIESGEFRENDPDFLTWAFLGLASGMLDVRDTPPGSPSRPPAPTANEAAADKMVDLFLEGARA